MWVVRQGCACAQFLEDMKTEDREYLEEAIAKSIPSSILLKALRAEGYKTSRDSLYSHYNKTCKCNK